jgi:hypothetical protein
VAFDVVGKTNDIDQVKGAIWSSLNSSSFAFDFDGAALTAAPVLWQDGAVISGQEAVSVTPAAPVAAPNGLSPGEVAGVVVCVLLFIAIFAILLFLWKKKTSGELGKEEKGREGSGV